MLIWNLTFRKTRAGSTHIIKLDQNSPDNSHCMLKNHSDYNMKLDKTCFTYCIHDTFYIPWRTACKRKVHIYFVIHWMNESLIQTKLVLKLAQNRQSMRILTLYFYCPTEDRPEPRCQGLNQKIGNIICFCPVVSPSMVGGGGQNTPCLCLGLLNGQKCFF